MWKKMSCFGISFFPPFLLPVPFLPFVQLLENGLQLQPLTVKNHLELIALADSYHDTKLLAVRAFDTQFCFVVRMIPNKDNPKGHPSLHINLWFERRYLAMYRECTPYMLRRRQR